jgi:hypothetical protein
MLGGFGYLVYQFSFWAALGVIYMVSIALVVLFAFASRSSRKDSKTAYQ